jgi:ubiquinone/menaquinone biosynthesis C-methylase UbiE
MEINSLGIKRVAFTQERIHHWDNVAREYNRWVTGRGYHRRLIEFFRYLIPENSRVLEIGCGAGDLLSALKPSFGVGVDFSTEMIALARKRHTELEFIEMDAHQLSLKESFDFIILSDLVNDVWNVQEVLQQVRSLCTPKTRVLINFYSRLWSPFLSLGAILGLTKPNLPQNWLTSDDIQNLLFLEDFEYLRHWNEILLPLPIPVVAAIFNKFLVKIFPFYFFALTNVISARLMPGTSTKKVKSKVTVLVPARNEAGNIQNIFNRVPEMGGGTELLFVEGHSKDNTYEAIEKTIKNNSKKNAKLIRQTGKGKGDAVRLGFANAGGDILMILDADLTVAPEELPKFYEALVQGKGDFINGVRLVYPMESEAMRPLNFLGNKAFSVIFRWALGQPVKDTLCGTKVLWKEDYERIAANRAYFGDFDPFGDFDLLFGADKLGLKIADLPIRYFDRVYGTTNIQRWRHGWMLIKMVIFALGKIKFV